MFEAAKELESVKLNYCENEKQQANVPMVPLLDDAVVKSLAIDWTSFDTRRVRKMKLQDSVVVTASLSQ